MPEDTSIRIRFQKLDLRRMPNGRCSAHVTLAWPERAPVVGAAEGLGSDVGVLQCVARATARALESAADDRIKLTLQGVTTIKAFDAVIVVVSLESRTSEHQQRLVGSAVAENQPEQAIVRAVLNATNRLIGATAIYLR
jgi:hypothetical protein